MSPHQVLPPEGVQELLPEPELVLRAAVPRLQGERRRVLLPRRRQERPGRRDLRRLIIALVDQLLIGPKYESQLSQASVSILY